MIAKFVVGLVAAHLATAGNQWKWSLGLGAIPALLLVALLQFDFLAGAKFNRDDFAPEGEPALVREKLFARRNLRPILLATSVAVFNQLSGVNVLLLYLLDVLSSAGMGKLLGHTYTVLISAFCVIMTLVGMALVDKAGRKPLLIWGSAGMAVCLLALGLAIPHRLSPLFYLSILVTYHACFPCPKAMKVSLVLINSTCPVPEGESVGAPSSSGLCLGVQNRNASNLSASS